MKILAIERTIEQGGGQTASVYGAVELSKLGHEVKIAAVFVNLRNLPRVALKLKYLTPPSLVSKLCQKSRLALFFLGPVFLFFTVFKASKDVSLLNPTSFPTQWIGILCGLLRKKPVVWSCYEPYIDILGSDIKKVGFLSFLVSLLAKSPLDKFLSRKIDKIITLDKKNKNRVKKLYNRSSIINNPGVDFDFYQKNSLITTGNQRFQGTFNLLTIGAFTPMKNQVIVIESLAKVRKKITNAILLIVGKGPEEESLKKRVKNLRLEKAVHFLGWLSEEEKRNLYHLCNLYLFPAVNQTWGLTPFEALCAKKLSIVSSDCGAAEVLGKEKIGIIVKPDVANFAREILEYYSHQKKYQEMINRGYNFVKDELTWRNFALVLEKEMKKVLNRRGE
jgi:glycosyltransferase involved in cell wall biosynthesis